MPNVLRLVLAAVASAIIVWPTLAASSDAPPAAATHAIDKIGLSDALAMAERRIRGGTVLNADLRLRNSRRIWDVEMVRHGKKVTVWIDAGDGTIKAQTHARE